MWIIEALLLLTGGVLAIPNLVLEKFPNASKAIEKVTPYQTWIGLILLLWGIWDFLYGLLFSRWVFSTGFLSSLLMIAVFVIEIGLGLVLSMSLLKQQKGLPQDKLEQLEKYVTKYQAFFGIGGIGAAVYVILRYTLLSPFYF